MFSVLMKYIFAFSIGILIGYIVAYEEFQNQLKKGLLEHQCNMMLDELKGILDEKDL